MTHSFPDVQAEVYAQRLEEANARIAARHRISIGKRSPHRFMRDQCADLMTGREIVAAVCAALRARPAFAAGSDAPIEGVA